MEEQVDLVPQAEEVVVEANFVPSQHLVDVLRRDRGSCCCGLWHFYSAVCGHLYQEHQSKCGAKRTGKGIKSAFCPKTSSRVLIKVNAPCPSLACRGN
jgi:hypothetical protein